MCCWPGLLYSDMSRARVLPFPPRALPDERAGIGAGELHRGQSVRQGPGRGRQRRDEVQHRGRRRRGRLRHQHRPQLPSRHHHREEGNPTPLSKPLSWRLCRNGRCPEGCRTIDRYRFKPSDNALSYYLKNKKLLLSVLICKHWLCRHCTERVKGHDKNILQISHFS